MDVIDTLAGKVVHAFEPGKGILHMEFTPRGENVWLSARSARSAQGSASGAGVSHPW